MDNQTPINQLDNLNDSDPKLNETVDDIINQINGGEDPSLNMPDMNTNNNVQEVVNIQQPMGNVEPVPLEAPPVQVMPPVQVQRQENVDTSNLNNNIQSLSNTIVTELKQPLSILVLYCLLNIKQVDNVFKLKNIKYLVSENGDLTFLSVVIKGVILALLFYLIKLFV